MLDSWAEQADAHCHRWSLIDALFQKIGPCEGLFYKNIL